MIRFKHILFVSTPESNQDNAVAMVKRFAGKLDAKVTLLTVLTPSTSLFGLSEGLDALMQEQAEHNARTQLSALAGHFEDAGIEVAIQVLWGNTSEQASLCARQQAIDLIAISATVEHSLQGYLFGTTAMQLIRRCPLPVWAIHKDARMPKRLLSAVDLQAETPQTDALARRLIDTGMTLADQLNAQFHLGCAWALENEGYLQIRGGIDEADFEQINQRLERKLESRMQTLLDDTDEASAAEVHTHLRHGSPVSTLTGMVTELHIDLMIIASLNRKGVEGLLIGNTAETLLQRTPCSILVIKPQAPEQTGPETKEPG
ncbi:Universal stress protein E like protein [Saliniradius amylolyticus]|uniref:Universal stress protein E like protein n=1 Tax=Saliniradius amylolyticus TaxID=2183582 RepID=A0A2S2E4U3_9ALTE|nr:universal stress protein [Saliniradius amylolyticus]AWL12260.1 Universal stress protein E like protein [Saliniradius amylolyticus]